jgi:hypothetical protein
MFPVRSKQGTGTRDESQRLEKIGDNGVIHFSNDFSKGGRDPISFGTMNPVRYRGMGVIEEKN